MATAAFNQENNGFSSSDDENMNNTAACGYPFQLLDQALEEKFSCIICGEIIKTFMEIPCKKGHGGCKYCVERWEDIKYKLV